MTIGERLKQLRLENRKTLRQVSDDTTISNSNLSEIENNVHGCNASTLNMLANYYNVSIDYILCKTDNPKATIIQVADSDGSITSIEYELLDKVKGFTTDDMQKVFEYVDFIKSKSEGKK